MKSPQPYAEFDLPGNHTVRIYDHSRVYFGDYYRVVLEVRCEIPLPAAPEPSGEQAGKPASVAVYSRHLERMAVASSAVDVVRQELIAEFRRNALPYLSTADFPAKLIARTLMQQPGGKKRYTVSAG